MTMHFSLLFSKRQAMIYIAAACTEFGDVQQSTDLPSRVAARSSPAMTAYTTGKPVRTFRSKGFIGNQFAAELQDPAFRIGVATHGPLLYFYLSVIFTQGA